jgi:hypothetical protein
MPVFDGSRYEGALSLRVPDADGEVKPALYSVVPPITTGMRYQTYAVLEGDRVDLLAYRMYGDPQLWWLIANANPEVFFPDDLVAGAIIRLPVL